MKTIVYKTIFVVCLGLSSLSSLASNSPTWLLAPSFGISTMKVDDSFKVNNDDAGAGFTFHASATYVSPFWLTAEMGVGSQSHFDRAILKGDSGVKYGLTKYYALLGMRLEFAGIAMTPKAGIALWDLSSELRNGSNTVAERSEQDSDLIWELQFDSNAKNSGMGFVMYLRGINTDLSNSVSVDLGPIFYF